MRTLRHQLKRTVAVPGTSLRHGNGSASGVRCFSHSSDSTTYSNDSTTYSGGQPNQGQGGFYGSIKSRSDMAAEFIPGSRVEAGDLKHLEQLMEKWETLAADSKDAEEQQAAWEQLRGEQATVDLVKRLIVKGGPAWGLSVPQREFVSRFHR